jgi:integrase
MRSEWEKIEVLEHVLAALTPQNRLACSISLSTGLRIGDVLALKTEQLEKSNRFVIKEQKTGKRRQVYFSKELREALLCQSGRIWVFENRLSPVHHRTRQAVYKDIRRAAAAFRVRKHISPHTMRKAFAVNFYQKCGNLGRVKDLLNHSSEAVTMIYAMADVLTQKKVDKKKKIK